MDTRDFINGERLQSIADMFLGSVEDITSNPLIFEQIEKHQILENIDCMFDNPRILFLYPHHMRIFTSRLKYFTNPFVLITHNSDVNLVETNQYVREILESPLLLLVVGTKSLFHSSQDAFLADWSRKYHVGTRRSQHFRKPLDPSKDQRHFC